MGVAHRDIKPGNVVFDNSSKETVRLVDFGFAASFRVDGGSTVRKLKTLCGSPAYMAPELVRGGLYLGPPVDVWAFGTGPACLRRCASGGLGRGRLRARPYPCVLARVDVLPDETRQARPAGAGAAERRPSRSSPSRLGRPPCADRQWHRGPSRANRRGATLLRGVPFQYPAEAPNRGDVFKKYPVFLQGTVVF